MVGCLDVDTVALRECLARLRRERRPFFLCRAELERIAQWKLEEQYGRDRRLLERLTDELVKPVSMAAFLVRDSDPDVETRVRLDVLMSLPGVGIGIASAILALTLPETHCVVDFRGWREIFKEDREQFTVQQYLQYLHEVQGLAARLGCCTQEVDLALWQLSRSR